MKNVSRNKQSTSTSSYGSGPHVLGLVDLAKPMDGVMFLTLIDSHSNEKCYQSSYRAIAQFGISETSVSDNGTVCHCAS